MVKFIGTFRERKIQYSKLGNTKKYGSISKNQTRIYHLLGNMLRNFKTDNRHTFWLELYEQKYEQLKDEFIKDGMLLKTAENQARYKAVKQISEKLNITTQHLNRVLKEYSLPK